MSSIYNRFFKILSLVLALGSCFHSISAKNIDICYISYDRNTKIDKLFEELKNKYEIAIKTGNALIIYLPYGKSSSIVEVNTNNDNREDFNNLLSQLSEHKSKTDPSLDTQNIINIVTRNPIDGGNYNSYSFNFYLSDLFWIYNYNEKIISRLYWILDLKEFIDNIVNINIFSVNDIKTINNQYFGPENLDNINNALDLENNIMTY